MKKTIPYLIILGLIAYIIFFKGCNVNPDYELIDTTTTTTIKYDSSKVTIEEKPELAKEEISPEYRWLYHDVDSASIRATVEVDSAYIMSLVKFDTLGIVLDWLLERMYPRDTIVNEVHLIDSIWITKNRLLALKTEIKNLRPTEHKTETKYNFQPIPNKFYIGGKLQSNMVTSNVFATGGYQRGKMLYTGGIGLFKDEDNRRPFEVVLMWGFNLKR